MMSRPLTDGLLTPSLHGAEHDVEGSCDAPDRERAGFDVRSDAEGLARMITMVTTYAEAMDAFVVARHLREASKAAAKHACRCVTH